MDAFDRIEMAAMRGDTKRLEERRERVALCAAVVGGLTKVFGALMLDSPKSRDSVITTIANAAVNISREIQSKLDKEDD